MKTLKHAVDGVLVVKCTRKGCACQHPIPYEALKKEVDYADRGDLDGAIVTIVREAGWTPELACPNHLDTRGVPATIHDDGTVVVALTEDDKRRLEGRTFRVRLSARCSTASRGASGSCATRRRAGAPASRAPSSPSGSSVRRTPSSRIRRRTRATWSCARW